MVELERLPGVLGIAVLQMGKPEYPRTVRKLGIVLNVVRAGVDQVVHDSSLGDAVLLDPGPSLGRIAGENDGLGILVNRLPADVAQIQQVEQNRVKYS